MTFKRFFNKVKETEYTKDELVQTVQNFMIKFETQFQQLWNENEEDQEKSAEAIEGIITKQLYKKLFSVYPNEKN